MQQKRSLDLWATLVSLLSIVIVGGVIWVILNNNPGNSLRQGSQGSITAPPPPATLPPLAMTAIANQQATQGAIETIVALKRTDATARVFELTASPHPTSIPAPTGIFDDEYVKAEWRKQGFIVENAWGGYINGNDVNVWAGAMASDPDQGIIHVLWIFPYRNLEQRFSVPGKHGSVRITGEQNNRLTLVSTDGTTFYFDVPGLQFASSLTQIVPTSMPPPSYTPPVPPITPAPSAYPPYPGVLPTPPATGRP